MEEEFKKALLEFDRSGAEQIIYRLFFEKKDFDTANNIIVNTLESIGKAWSEGEIALAQIYMSSQICEDIYEKIISPASNHKDNNESIAIVTLNDYHVLGKKIVYSFLRSNGYYLVDYGTENNPKELVKRAISDNIKILLISTLMYHSALKVREVKELFEKENYNIRILVGGAPYIFDKMLWKEVKADAMGVSPADAVEILNNWINN